MAKVSAECLEGALTALQHFSSDELKQYATDVFNRAREFDEMSSSRALQRAADEINNERLRAYFEDATIKANNITKFENNAKKIKNKKADMRSLLTTRYNNLGDNVKGAQRAAQSRLERKFFNDLTQEEVNFLSDSQNQDMIADAYDGLKVSNPIAKRLGEKLHEYFPYRNSELVISNAMRFDEINNDRNFRAVHDQGRLVSGGKSLWNAVKDRAERKYDISASKGIWRDFIKRYLDLEGTFQYTDAKEIDGSLNMGKADEILERIYDNITTGKSEIFTRSAVVNDREAVQRKSRMFFKWKNMRAFLEYNKTYGKGDLFGALRSDIHAAGSKIGLAEQWGDSPYNMYNDLRQVQKDATDKNDFWFNNTENYFKSVMGLDRVSKSPTVSNFTGNIRALTSMARLFKIALQSVSDIGYIAAFGQRMGVGYWRTYFNQLRHIFDTFPTEERSRIAKTYRLMVDSHLGYNGRWLEANNTSEFINKISTKYFKAIQLEAFDRGNKVGLMHLMSKSLYENSGKSFDELNPSLKKWVGKFMEAKDWELLRTKNKDGLFTVENVESLSNDELKSHHIDTGQRVPLYQMRNDLYRRVYSMFDVASENAVLAPTDFERAWLLQGEAPGTIKGEALRTITQFKMYTMAYIDRVLVQGWKDSDTMQQKLAWATSLMVGTIPLAALSTFLDNYSNGVSMPDWDEMNVSEREKYLVSIMQPSLVLFNSLLDPKNQNSSSVFSLMSSPSTRLISNAIATASATANGNLPKAAKELKGVAEYMAPISSIPFVSPFIREMLGEEAYLQPGQRVLYGA